MCKTRCMMGFEIIDHSAEVSAEIKAALLRGLEKCGLVALSMRLSSLLREIGAVSELV